MMWADYYINDTTLNHHEVLVEGTTLICNELTCSFKDTFESLEDALVAKEIHEEYTKETP